MGARPLMFDETMKGILFLKWVRIRYHAMKSEGAPLAKQMQIQKHAMKFLGAPSATPTLHLQGPTKSEGVRLAVTMQSQEDSMKS